LVFLILLAGVAYPQQVPQVISFQGKLSDNIGAPITTAVDLRFRIYNQATGGTHLWEEIQASITPDVNGLYNVMLGSVTALIPTLPFNEQYWLEVGVQPAGGGPFEDLTPRYQMSSSPYALRARTLEGMATPVANIDQALQTIGGTVTSANLDTLTDGSNATGLHGHDAADLLTGTLTIAQGGTGATTATAALTSLGAAASGANADITSLTGLTTPLSIPQGGTGATTAAAARTALGAAASGNNSDITQLSGLTTAITIAQGGTGATTAAAARTALGAAASGANADITSLTGLTTPLSIAQGGTGAATAAAARTSLGAAASGANSDITSITGLTTPLSEAQGGTNQSGYAQGEIIYASAQNVLGRLGIGANNTVLTSNGTVPTWAPIGAHSHWNSSWTGSTAAATGLTVSHTGGGANDHAIQGSASGLGHGVRGINSGTGYGVYADSTGGGIGLFATGSGTGTAGPAVRVDNTNSSASIVYGIYATVGNAQSGSSGVYGRSTGSGRGVFGAAITGTGVYGAASGVGGRGVEGIANSSSGVGVFGNNTNTSGYAAWFTRGAGSQYAVRIDAGGGTNNGLYCAGNIETSGQFDSNVATGTAPLVVTSTTMVSNLNADRVDGLHASGFATSGANSNITSLTGLTTPLSIAQGGTGATTAAGALANLGAVSLSGNNNFTGSNSFSQTIVSSVSSPTAPLQVASTGLVSNLNADRVDGQHASAFATSGANSNITSLTGLTTPLSIGQGGTGANTAAGARNNLSAAASGNNNDITQLSGLTTAITIAQGGTGATTAGAARNNLGAAASGANSDITSLSGLTTPLSETQGGTNQATYAQGDILYASAANTLSKLNIGGNNTVLTSNGSTPVWAALGGHSHWGASWTGNTAAQIGLAVSHTGGGANDHALQGAASGLGHGVRGTNSGSGYGMYAANTGTGTGLYATSVGTGTGNPTIRVANTYAGASTAYGIYATAAGSGGQTAAVRGNNSGTGYGVWGSASSSMGVYGSSSGGTGTGVYGIATNGTGQVYGVRGYSNSTSVASAGVYGDTAGSGRGIYGRANNVAAVAVYGLQVNGGGYAAHFTKTAGAQYAVRVDGGGTTSPALDINGETRGLGRVTLTRVPTQNNSDNTPLLINPGSAPAGSTLTTWKVGSAYQAWMNENGTLQLRCLNVGGRSKSVGSVGYNYLSDQSALAPSLAAISTGEDLFVDGDVEIDGTLRMDGPLDQGGTAVDFAGGRGAGSGADINLPATSNVNLTSVTVNAPVAGYVIVSGGASFIWSPAAVGNTIYLYIGLNTASSGNTVGSQRRLRHICSSTAAHHFALQSSEIFSVSAGSTTFYLNCYNQFTTGGPYADNYNIQAVFIPKQY
jgi:hypothetical protein